MTVTIAPNNPAIIEYLAWIKRTRQRADAQHEGNVRHGFATLLEKTSKLAKLTLVQEYYDRISSGRHVRYDGRVMYEKTDYRHGHWEAKDTQDDLEAEIRKKRLIGYDFENIIFEDTHIAILYQKDQFTYRADLTKADQIARLLETFFNFNYPITELEQAIQSHGFKKKVTEIAEQLDQKIKEAHRNNRVFQSAFGAFMELCKSALNPNIHPDAVDEMLIQHILTERMISTIFDKDSFSRQNVIAAEIEKVIDALTSQHFNRREFLGNLNTFYNAIERAAERLANFRQKQVFLNRMYENFFQGYSVKTADTHGIVYTPHEIVDFMCAAVQEVLHDEWGYRLGDEEVKIIDPATGTGNFIVHLLDRADDRYLDAFYRTSLFANEVMLMPYYIASLNIETVYFNRTGRNEAFKGLSFVDTLELTESPNARMFTDDNTERIERQQQTPINVIIGNPPYNVGQTNENDNNKNRKYDGNDGKNGKNGVQGIDGRVKETYVKDSQASSRSKVYDPYVKFFRWATDRLDGRDGIVCMVTNNSFVDGVAFDGMRKHLLQDFTRVYHLDMGGDMRQKGGGNVFGIRVGVGITVAIRSKQHQESQLFYHALPNAWTASQKLAHLAEHVELQGRHNALNTVTWTHLTPNARHTWLVPQDEASFEEGIPIGTKDGKKKLTLKDSFIFKLYSLGLNSARDAIVYDFNQQTLQTRMVDFIAHYNAEVARYFKANRPEDVDNFVDYSYIKWSEGLKKSLSKGKQVENNSNKYRTTLYRPFTKQHLFYDSTFNERHYKQHLIFPTPESEQDNRVIIIPGIGNRRAFGVFMTQYIPSLDFSFEKVQCFPFYVYDPDGSNRRENITDWALQEFQAQHGASVTKWDIFYYVYGVLHDPTYRTRFADNLKKDLPRIPILPNFTAYRDAGKRLATLHLNYETQPRFRDLRWERRNDASGKPVALDYRVQKMKAISTEKHPDGYAIISAIQVNPTLTITNIPPEASAYRLGNRSALEWIIDQYQVKTDKRSGITSDPNTYSDDERYIIELVERVVTVSVETVKAVAGLAEG